MPPSIESSPERLSAFRAEADTAGPVVMINLLRYREQAQYSEDFDAEPCSGREAYRRYGEVAIKLIEAVGGRVVYRGRVQSLLIAPEGEEWDTAVLVEYPSRKALLDMLASEVYGAIVPHRMAALQDSRLIATETR